VQAELDREKFEEEAATARGAYQEARLRARLAELLLIEGTCDADSPSNDQPQSRVTWATRQAERDAGCGPASRVEIANYSTEGATTARIANPAQPQQQLPLSPGGELNPQKKFLTSSQILAKQQGGGKSLFEQAQAAESTPTREDRLIASFTAMPKSDDPKPAQTSSVATEAPPKKSWRDRYGWK